MFLITADGEPTENPRYYRTAERALQKAQQRVSRRKKGSKRCRKAAALCAKQHQQMRRQRQDFHHKTALALVRAYDTISVEAIQPASLSRCPAPKPDEHGTYEHNGASQKAGLNTSIHDAGWRHFLSLLAYKAACAGKRVEAVNPAYTTQDCSGVLPDGNRCTQRVVKSLSVRTHVCPSCGLVLDRDLNAALNILRAGQARQALTWPVGASVA